MSPNDGGHRYLARLATTSGGRPLTVGLGDVGGCSALAGEALGFGEDPLGDGCSAGSFVEVESVATHPGAVKLLDALAVWADDPVEIEHLQTSDLTGKALDRTVFTHLALGDAREGHGELARPSDVGNDDVG